MKHFLRGAAIVVVIMIILMAVNIICNMNGHELDAVTTGTAASIGAMLIDGGLSKKEKKKED